MSTTVPGGNGVAVSKLLFAHAIHDKRGVNGFANMLTDGADSVVDSAEERSQSNKGAPMIMIKDMKQGQDEIKVELYHDLEEPPVTGSEPVKGREERLRSDDFKMRVGLTRKGVVDEVNNQLRKMHDLLPMAEIKVKEFFPRWSSEVAKYMLAGDRGMHRGGALMPIDNGAGNIERLTFNGIQAPTFDEHFYGGDAGTVGSIDGTTGAAINSSARLTLRAIERITTEIDDADYPLGAVRYEGISDDIQGLIFVSAKGWTDFKQSDERHVDKLMADAKERVSGFNHEVFKQKCAVVNNYLIMQYPGKAIRWEGDKGHQIKVSDDNNDATTHMEEVPAGLFIERGIVLGRQAIAQCYAPSLNGQPFSIEYDSEDYNMRKGICVMINSAMKKIRMRDGNGRMRDMGVRTMDYAVAN